MYENLKGKRLLFLGAVRPLCEAVEIAKSMGIYTIVTDYLPDSPAKKHADKACMVSTTDVDAIVKLCKEERVDGVFTAFIDSMLPYARRVCDQLGFPFYASDEQIQLSLDKALFKETCRKYNVPVPQDYTMVINQETIDESNISFPVIVKPIDSSGGRGIRICNNMNELKKAYVYALEISPNNRVLVEEYVQGNEVTATYTMKDGNISLSCFKDKLISLDHDDITCQADVLIAPSNYLCQYVSDVNDKVINMLNGLNATDGTVFIQGIANNNEVKFFELGYRPNGGHDYRHIEAENGINFMKMMIAHALTGHMDGYELSDDNPFFSKYVLNLNIYSHGGKIGKIRGKSFVDSLDNVILCEYMHNEGDEIIDNNTLSQRVFRAVIRDNSIERIKQTIRTIQQVIEVRDVNGRNMLYKPFDAERLNQYESISLISEEVSNS